MSMASFPSIPLVICVEIIHVIVLNCQLLSPVLFYLLTNHNRKRNRDENNSNLTFPVINSTSIRRHSFRLLISMSLNFTRIVSLSLPSPPSPIPLKQKITTAQFTGFYPQLGELYRGTLSLNFSLLQGLLTRRRKTLFDCSYRRATTSTSSFGGKTSSPESRSFIFTFVGEGKKFRNNYVHP